MEDLDIQLETSAKCASRIVAALIQATSSIRNERIGELYKQLFEMVFKSLEDPEKGN